MDVKAQIKILLSLQGFDAELIELGNKLKSLPETLEEFKRDVTQLEEVVGSEQGELEQEDRWKVEKEEEHKFIEGQIVRLRKQMQESTAHRETLALQRQLDTSRKQSTDLEEEVLQLMQAVEARRAAIADHEASLDQLKEVLEKEEAEIRKQMKSVQAKINRITKARDAKGVDLDPKVKSAYARLAGRLHPSIVEALDGHCTGCNMAMRPQLYNTLFYANSLETCPMCYRLVYLKAAVFEEEEKADEADE